MNAAPNATAGAVPGAALELIDVDKSFGATRALSGVSLRVAAGTVHCVLGENGAGKSTLCHLVGGGLAPDRGALRLFGRPYAPRRPADALASGVAMVHQHFSLVETLTVAENLMLGPALRLRLPRRALADRLARIQDDYGLGLDPGARIADLPVGLRQRVEIVKCLLREPRLLLLDEPTAVLGPAETGALIDTCRRVAASGKAVVLITHKLDEVTRVADEATVLRGGRVAGGGPLAGLSQAELVSLMMGGAPGAARPAAAGLGHRARPARAAGPMPDGPPALRVRGLSLRRRDGGAALREVSLDVRPGEIVGVAGVEGNGQSELAAVLGGTRRPDAGTVELAGTDITRASPRRRTALGLGLIPEDRHHEGCVPELSVAENLFLGRLGDFRRRGGRLDRAAMDRAAEKVLAAHDIRAPGPRAPVRTLSGGNQQKTVLARELALDPLVCLVAAQPTRGLDLGAVDAVLGRLRDAAARGCGILVVSSELGELLALCDVIAVAHGGALLGPVPAAESGARDTIGRLMLGAAA